MRAGKLDTRVLFRFHADGVGELTKRCEVWAEWRPTSAQRRVEAHALTDGLEGQLRLRDGAAARTIVQADRALFRGQDLEVLSTPIPDRSGYLWIKVGRQIGTGG